VSILDFEELKTLLQIPQTLTVVAYLCVGYVSEFRSRPDLEENGWEHRQDLGALLHYDGWNRREGC
jgi:5,6-dimethylbenzimidazole synthase